MLKAFIVDDEIKAVELLQNYINQIDFIELVGTSRNSLKAFNWLINNKVDVLFLDINMPVLSGVEFFKNMSDPPAVIFTTAYPEFAVEGFNLEAVDYLLKPITFPRFLKGCQRLLNQHKSAKVTSTSQSDSTNDIVYVKSGTVTHKISWREVLYLEKDENYVIYHTAQKRILSRQTLTNLEKAFPSYICRIHKSYAISLLHVQLIEREMVSIAGKTIPVGRTYKRQLMNRLSN